MAESEAQNKKLSEVFDEVWKLYEFLERCDEPTVSDKVQNDVAKALALGEDAVHMINMLNLFTDNEDVKEVAANELRYLLMPALLAYFTSKSTKGDRFETVKKAQVYHVDFLRLMKLYAVKDIEVPNLSKPKEEDKTEEKATGPPARPGMPDLALMERQRKAKVARYREQKERDARLVELAKVVAAEHVDDDVRRNYYMTLLNSFISKTQDELDSIEMEIPMLEHMAKMKLKGTQNGTTDSAKPTGKLGTKKFAPFILTKDKLQAAVFGAGYPSLPTYSVEEWFDMNVAAGRMPDQGPTTLQGGENTQDSEADDIQKEEAAERDDPDALRKAREWDDWKDDHRRGWGNRQNMG